MIDQIVEEPVAAPEHTPPRPGEDLSGRIEQAVVRQRHDRVRCVRVSGDSYRCNWWAPAVDDTAPRGRDSAWAAVAMSRVRESRFLRATLDDGGALKIHEPRPAAGPAAGVDPS